MRLELLKQLCFFKTPEFSGYPRYEWQVSTLHIQTELISFDQPSTISNVTIHHPSTLRVLDFEKPRLIFSDSEWKTDAGQPNGETSEQAMQFFRSPRMMHLKGVMPKEGGADLSTNRP